MSVGSIWGSVFASMVWLEMDPRPALLAGIAIATAAALWLMVDLSDVAAPAAWGACCTARSFTRPLTTRVACCIACWSI